MKANRADSPLHISDEQLLASMDGELQADEETQVRAHLDRCDVCAARIVLFRRLSGDTNAAYLAAARRARGLLRLGLAVIATVCGLWWLSSTNAGGSESSSLASLNFGDLPMKYLTPGATRRVTISDLCQRSPERDDSGVPATVRRTVLRRYGAVAVSERDFELDYLITPELGGATDAQNLWPQGYTSAIWNAHVKDDLERLLHQLVCQGALPLESAQRDIATNWIAAYKHYFRTTRPGGWPAALPQPLPLRE